MNKRTHEICLWLTVSLVLVFVWPAVLWSQDDVSDASPGLTAFLDRESATLGSILVLTLGYSLPEGGRLSEKPQIKGLENLTVVGLDAGSTQIRVRLLVDTLDSWKTGPLSLAYLDKDGNVQVLGTDPVSIKVISNLGDKPEEAQLRPIQPIMPTRARWLKYLPWAAGLMGIVLVGAGFFLWHRKRRIQKIFAELIESPHVRARREIERLEAQGLFEKGQVKAFYFRFSGILRRYLESIRGFPAAEFTTEEIAFRINTEQDRGLLPLLRQADLVKFADSVPTPARKEEQIRTALSYIQQTAPVIETSYKMDGPKQVVAR